MGRHVWPPDPPYQTPSPADLPWPSVIAEHSPVGAQEDDGVLMDGETEAQGGERIPRSCSEDTSEPELEPGFPRLQIQCPCSVKHCLLVAASARSAGGILGVGK